MASLWNPPDYLRECVRIGPATYWIRLVAGLHDGKTGLNGWVRHNDRLILLDAGLHPHELLMTLWHEIFHVIVMQSGHKVDHSLLEALTTGTVDAIAENPFLVQTGLREIGPGWVDPEWGFPLEPTGEVEHATAEV